MRHLAGRLSSEQQAYLATAPESVKRDWVLVVYLSTLVFSRKDLLVGVSVPSSIRVAAKDSTQRAGLITLLLDKIRDGILGEGTPS